MKTVFLTFLYDVENLSWEVVKLLPSKVIEEDVEIFLLNVPKAYTSVIDKLEALWEQHNPNLVIHVNNSRLANKMTIGKKASPQEGNDIIDRQINVEKICKEVNDSFRKIVACTIEETERFLSEYTFYESLKKNVNKIMFIQFPLQNELFPPNHIVSYLLYIMELTLKDMKNCERQS